MGFTQGIDAAQKKAEENKFAPRSGPNYLKVTAGDSAVFMVLHDGWQWLAAETHAYVPSKIKDDKGAFRGFSAVCRRDEGIDADECYICDELHTVVPNEKTQNAKKAINRGRYFAQQRYYLPVLMLEDIIGTQEMIDADEIPATMKLPGRPNPVSTVDLPVGRKVRTVEVEETDDDGNPTGKKVMRPDVRLWVAAPSGAVATLAEDYHDTEKGTVCAHPYRLKREGSGRDDTQYLLSSVKAVKDLDLTEASAREPYLEHLDVIALLTEQGSTEYYERLFDRRVQTEDDEEAAEGETPASQLNDDQAVKLAAITATMRPSRAAVGS